MGRRTRASGAHRIRVVIADEYDRYGEVARQLFWHTDWRVTPQSNRYGFRLEWPRMMSIAPIEKRSHGIVPGVIQIPPNGQPIIQLREAQTSGGYPKFATVIEADLWRIGQPGLGSRQRFEARSHREALAAQAETVVKAGVAGVHMARHPSRDDPFVQLGQAVTKGEIVGLVKIGRIYTPILSPMDGSAALPYDELPVFI